MWKEKKPWRNDFVRQNIAKVVGQRVWIPYKTRLLVYKSRELIDPFPIKLSTSGERKT